MDFRFVAYNPQTGQRLYQLPRATSVQIGDTFGTRGTLELEYSAKAIDARELPTFVEVQAEVTFDEGHTWAEVGPSLLRLSGEHEDTDQAGMRTLRFVGREWILEKARVGAGELELIDGKRPFYRASPGSIIRTLLLEAQDRGAAQGIEIGGFTASKDSAGNAWPKVATIYYSPGLPIGSVLENLVEQGLCDYRMDGRTLNLYAPETAMGRDLTIGANPVRVHGAVTEAPVKYSLEDLASSALLIGDEGFELEVDNPSAPDDYGRLEVTIEQGGVSDAGTARVMVDEALQRGSREIREITRSQSASGAAFLPYRDYRVGDFVQVFDGGQWARYRVREIQLQRDGQEWAIHTVINDRLQELLLKLAKRTNGIVNGSKGSGGDGTRPTPPENPGIEPAAPEGLVIDQQVYLDRQGIARGQITAGWGAVTESTKGTSVEIGGYELWWRRNETGEAWTRAAVTDQSTTVTHSPVVLTDTFGNAMEYQWRVRAIAQASNRPGPWSDSVTLTMTQDTEPPNVPSLPTVTTDLRIITVEIDGLDEYGEAMPVDYNHTRIYFAAAESMAGAERVGSLTQLGTWNSGSMDPDVPVWVAVSAVDNVGNESAMTPAQSVKPRRLVDDDSIRDAVDGIDDKINDAVEGLNEAIDNIVIDVEGTKNFYTSEMPLEGMSEGDLWYDPSDKNKPYIYQDGEWITVRDQFLKPPTTRNVTDWGLLKPNLSAVDGQWSSTDYSVEIETLEDLGSATIGVVNIPDADSGGGYITMPFQGVLDGSDFPEHSDDLFVYEGRPISIDLQLLYSGPFEPGAGQRTLTAHYFAEGVLVDSRSIDYASLDTEVAPASPDFSNPLAYYAQLLGYQYGMRVTGTVMPSNVASVDEVALTVSIPLPAGRNAKKKIAVWSIDTRVQVPTTGLADGAITETKVSDDAISTPKLRANAITAGKIAANAIETDHLKSKVITGDKLAVGAITADSGIIGSINAGTITVGEMDGAHIGAKTISAGKLLIGQGGELTVNPFFDNEGAGWGSSTGGASFTYSSDAAYAGHSYGLKAVPTEGGATIYFTSLGSAGTQRIVMEHGKTYQIETWVRRTAGNVSNLSTLQLRGYFYLNATGGTISNQLAAGGSIQASSVPADTWVKVTGVYTPPSPSHVYMYPRPTIYTSSNHPADAATWHLGMLSIKEQVGATLIEDGAITTDKILANAITAGKIAAGAIEADHIAANAITADKIKAGSIDSMLITGARYRTAASGRRTELDVEGLRSYDSSGAVVLTTQTSDGSIDMRGILSQTISGVTLRVGVGWEGNYPGVQWSDSNIYNYPPGVGLKAVDGETSKKETLIQGPGVSTGNSYLSLKERGERFRLRTWRGAVSSPDDWVVDGNLSNNLMRIGSSAGSAPYMYFRRGTGDTGTAWLGYNHPTNGGYASLALRDRYAWLGTYDSASTAVGFLSMTADGTTLSGYKRNTSIYGGDGASIHMRSTSNGPRLQSQNVYNTTSDSGYSVQVNKAGTLFSVSSSLRYKQDVAPAGELSTILDVEPKVWRNKSSMENARLLAGLRSEIGQGPIPVEYAEAKDESEVPWEYGAVAEEVDELGLNQLVLYDEYGRPDALQYEKFGVALIPIIRRLRDRVDALEQQLGETA